MRSEDEGGIGMIGNPGLRFGTDVSLPTLPIPHLSPTYPPTYVFTYPPYLSAQGTGSFDVGLPECAELPWSARVV